MVKTLEMALNEVRDSLVITADRLARVMSTADNGNVMANEIDLTHQYDAYMLLSNLMKSDLEKYEITSNTDDLHQSTVATVAFIRKKRAELPLSAQVIYGGVEILLGEIIMRFRCTSRDEGKR